MDILYGVVNNTEIKLFIFLLLAELYISNYHRVLKIQSLRNRDNDELCAIPETFSNQEYL